MDRIEVQRVMPCGVAPVRRRFWDFAAWQRIWDRLASIQVRYDDGAHQEIAMIVDRDGHREEVRTARFLDHGDIAFFSPQPPPTMTVHTGAWCFADETGGCLVTARRAYELTPGRYEASTAYARRRLEYRTRFQDRVGRILDCFVDHFANQGVSHEL